MLQQLEDKSYLSSPSSSWLLILCTSSSVASFSSSSSKFSSPRPSFNLASLLPPPPVVAFFPMGSWCPPPPPPRGRFRLLLPIPFFVQMGKTITCIAFLSPKRHSLVKKVSCLFCYSRTRERCRDQIRESRGAHLSPNPSNKEFWFSFLCE